MKRSVYVLSFAGVAAATAGAAAPAWAADLKVTYEIPRIPVAEYHAPYTVIWIENPATGEAAGTLSLRFRPRHEKWLKDMRQWWRKAGRAMGPADGVTGPTRAPGVHDVTFSGAKGPLAALKPGQYTLVVEAAREAGGHESVRVPFSWGAKSGRTTRAKGATEIGAVTVAVK